MKNTDKSILVISGDMEMNRGIRSALAAASLNQVTTQDAGLVAMNGSAVPMAMKHDIVILGIDPDNDAEVEGLRALAKAKRDGAIIVGIADASAPLAKAKALARAGVDEVLAYPFDPQEIAAIAARASAAPGAAPKLVEAARKQGAVIAVAPARGGVGATTLAVNLACSLLDRQGFMKKVAKNRVALVDLDIQFGNAALMLDLEDQGGLTRLAQDGGDPDQVFLKTAMVEHKTGLVVLPAPGKAMPLDALEPRQIAALIDALQAEYDYVVIDMPRALVSWIEPVLERASQLLMVTDMTVPSIRQAKRLMDFFAEDHAMLPIEVVMAQENKPLFRSRHHREAAKTLGRPLNHWLPNNYKAARDAADRGEPLVELRRSAGLSKSFRRFAQEFLASKAAK